MERKRTSDEVLLNYLDGALNDDQSRQLKTELSNSPELQQRLEELRMVHVVLGKKNALQHPSSNFTHRVMGNLHRMPVASNLSPRNGIFLLCGILVAIGMLGVLMSGGVFDAMNESIELTKLPVPANVIKNPLPESFSLNGKWIINGIVILALGLSFILLDRTILRPYFSKRSHLQY